MFEKCCNNQSVANYEITHYPKPLIVSEDMDKMIKELLLYVPNINSFQSEKNELIEDTIYDDLSFSFILNLMGMEETSDVKWLSKKEISKNDWKFYEKSICCNCQKLILSRYKSHSKTNDLLRCIRNCIAHGQFSVVNDYLIGFNKKITQKRTDGIRTAIVKIKPRLLLNAINALTSPMAKEYLLSFAFKRIGYTILYEPGRATDMFDLIIEKRNIKYVVEIKSFKGSSYIHLDDISRFLYKSEQIYPGITRVLFIDTSRVTKDVRQKEMTLNNLKIVDLSQIKMMLGDDPIDILA